MKAAVLREFGAPSVLKLEEVPTPEVRPGHVLIKVLATGVNRLEDYLRSGTVVPLKFPHVLGSDAAGEVAAVGSGVSRFKVGDRVIPMPGYPLDVKDYPFTPMSAAPSYAIGGIVEWGTYAQYIQVAERWVVRDETGLPPEDVATLPMVVVTAVRAVKRVGEVKEGDHVLIHAGASGTGSMNIQVAKALGAKVATTVDSIEKGELARRIGADLVIDVQKDDFVKVTKDWTNGRGLDVVIDNLGGPVLQKSLDALRPLGVCVAMGFVAGVEVTFHVRNFFFTHKQIRGTLMGDVDDMTWGLDLVKKGKIVPQLDKALPLAQAAEVHRLLSENKVRGNIVMLPWAA
jgi:NADPH:quinone reductase